MSESSDSDGYLNVLRSLAVSIVAKVEGMWDTEIQKVLERTRYVKEMEAGETPAKSSEICTDLNSRSGVNVMPP